LIKGAAGEPAICPKEWLGRVTAWAGDPRSRSRDCAEGGVAPATALAQPASPAAITMRAATVRHPPKPAIGFSFLFVVVRPGYGAGA
jgi:hypothetical protein